MSDGPMTLHIRATLARMNSVLPSLRPAEQRVAQFILKNPRLAVEMSITETASAVGTSETSVVRLAKTIGFRGFRELKLAIATELPATEVNVYQDLRPGETLEDIASSFFGCVVRAFSDTASLIDYTQLQRAVDILDRAERVACFGSGASGYVAQDAQQKLLRVNIRAWAFVDPHEQLAFAAKLGKGDAVIAISHSGYTRDVIDAVLVAKDNAAASIAVVGDPTSELASVCDVVLVAASQEVPLKSGTVVSRLTQLAMIDLLTLGIASRHKDEIMTQFERRQTVLAKIRTRSNSATSGAGGSASALR